MKTDKPTRYDDLLEAWKIRRILSRKPREALELLIEFALEELGWEDPKAFTFSPNASPPDPPNVAGMLKIVLAGDVTPALYVFYGRPAGFPTGDPEFKLTLPPPTAAPVVTMKTRQSISDVAALIYNQLLPAAVR